MLKKIVAGSGRDGIAPSSLVKMTDKQLNRALARIVLLNEEKAERTPAELLALPEVEGKKNLCVCDFAVKGAETGKIDGHVITADGVLIIDHHIPISELFADKISSTTVAIEYVKKHGSLSSNYKVLIHHTDCDSVLSSLIMTGFLEPDEKYNEAAIATDHLGAATEIGELLAVLAKTRDVKQMATALRNFLKNGTISPENQVLLTARTAKRDLLKQNIESHEFETFHYGDAVCVYTGGKKWDESEFVIPLFPDARVILLVAPMPDAPDKWDIQFRQGMNSGRGIYFNELKPDAFAGRWNCGGTSRNGGTTIEPKEYTRLFWYKIVEYLVNRDAQKVGLDTYVKQFPNWATYGPKAYVYRSEEERRANPIITPFEMFFASANHNNLDQPMLSRGVEREITRAMNGVSNSIPKSPMPSYQLVLHGEVQQRVFLATVQAITAHIRLVSVGELKNDPTDKSTVTVDIQGPIENINVLIELLQKPHFVAMSRKGDQKRDLGEHIFIMSLEEKNALLNLHPGFIFINRVDSCGIRIMPKIITDIPPDDRR